MLSPWRVDLCNFMQKNWKICVTFAFSAASAEKILVRASCLCTKLVDNIITLFSFTCCTDKILLDLLVNCKGLKVAFWPIILWIFPCEMKKVILPQMRFNPLKVTLHIRNFRKLMHVKSQNSNFPNFGLILPGLNLTLHYIFHLAWIIKVKLFPTWHLYFSFIFITFLNFHLDLFLWNKFDKLMSYKTYQFNNIRPNSSLLFFWRDLVYFSGDEIDKFFKISLSDLINWTNSAYQTEMKWNQ